MYVRFKVVIIICLISVSSYAQISSIDVNQTSLSLYKDQIPRLFDNFRYLFNGWTDPNALGITTAISTFNVYNVKNAEYGARGDGTTDDTTAITAALAATATGIVYFPSGTYLTTGGFTITDQMILGSGPGATIIKKRSGTSTMFTVDGLGSVDRLTIDCNELYGNGLVYTTAAVDFDTGWTGEIVIKNTPTSPSCTAITGASNASACVITSTGHGLSTGDMVRIRNITGLVSQASASDSPIEGVYRVTYVSANSFSIPEDTSSYTAYSSGGTWERASYAICFEQTTGKYLARNKYIKGPLKIEDCYGGIYVGYATDCFFENFVIIGDCNDAAIFISNLDVRNITFRNWYIEGGIRTSHNGIRDVRFESGRCSLTAANSYEQPFYYSLGFNASNGNVGGEVSKISFRDIVINRGDDDATNPFFYTNNYNLRVESSKFLDSATTNALICNDYGTYNSSWRNNVFEMTNAWYWFVDGCNGATRQELIQNNYEQGVNGTVILSARKLSGETTGHIYVSHSNLDYEIEGPSGTARGYIFNQVSGDIDLTNAATGGCILLNCTGSVTEGTGEITLRTTYTGGVFIDDLDVSGVYTEDTTKYLATKTVKYSIDVDDDASTDDYQFDDDAANQNEQVITITNALPAYAELVSCQLRCFETVTGSTSMGIDVGTSSGGNEILSTADTDTANDINSSAATVAPELGATNAARSVYVNATPGANWNTLDAGRWMIMLTYIDYASVYSN